MACGNSHVLRCGINFCPPSLILFYEADNKVRKRLMPIRNFRTNSSVKLTIQDLKMRHDILQCVPDVCVEKMLRLLQEHLKGSTLENSLKEVNSEFSIDPNEDLNHLDEVQVKRKKEIMDQSFCKTQIKPSDPKFVYDKRVEFDNNCDKMESGWDVEDADDFWN